MGRLWGVVSVNSYPKSLPKLESIMIIPAIIINQKQNLSMDIISIYTRIRIVVYTLITKNKDDSPNRTATLLLRD